VWMEVLDTALNKVLLPLLGIPTSAMRRRRLPRNKGVRSGMAVAVGAGFTSILFRTPGLATR